MRRAPVVTIDGEERRYLEKCAAGRRTPARLVLRAKIVLLAAEGLDNQQISERLGTSTQTVGLWRKRYVEKGRAGIEKDAPRGGRPDDARQAAERRIIEVTTQEKPRKATQWSTRTLAKKLGVSRAMVHRVWNANGLKPHLHRTFKLSNDPNFESKLIDVVGLYLNPPEHAIVLSVDEKSQIQALDRTQPGLPIKKGRCGTMTHDYKRNGTTTLFAAMDTLEGKVLSSCMPRHRHQEFIRFLNQIDEETQSDVSIHLILDNYGTHKHAKVQLWLKRHPRFRFHFIPTSSSWLNVVERFFRDLTTDRIRRDSFGSVPELIDAIEDYIDAHNDDPRPFIWTAEADKILEKVGRARTALLNQQQRETLH
jgi:transposase